MPSPRHWRSFLRRQKCLSIGWEKDLRCRQRHLLTIEHERAVIGCEHVATPVRLRSIRQRNKYPLGGPCDVHRGLVGDTGATSDVAHNAKTRLAPLDGAHHAWIDHAHESPQQG